MSQIFTAVKIAPVKCDHWLGGARLLESIASDKYRSFLDFCQSGPTRGTLKVMAAATSSEFRAQWTRPSDTFSILLIVGGDVIQLALANLTGAFMTPIAFSFGWVAYAITAVLGAAGDNRLINCAPEVPLKVFDLKTRYGRDNRSWLLGRLMKTYDSWMPEEVREKMGQRRGGLFERRGGPPDEEAGQRPQPAQPPRVGLCVAVYTWGGEAGRPTLDFIWWSGLVTTVVQLAVAAIPWILRGNWAIFLAAGTGTLLAYTSASLPHWREEKFKARRKSDYEARRRDDKQDYALTSGQGSQHVLVVMGARRGENNTPWGLNLADLAGGRTPEMPNTRIWTAMLAVLWVVFLITCIGIVSDTWFLLAVGGLGMLHNLVAAGWPRRPEAMGLPITLFRTNDNGQEGQAQIFAEKKVMWTLMELELKHAGFGKALLREFFPGPLWEWEDEWWDAAQERRAEVDRWEVPDLRAVLDAEKENERWRSEQEKAAREKAARESAARENAAQEIVEEESTQEGSAEEIHPRGKGGFRQGAASWFQTK